MSRAFSVVLSILVLAQAPVLGESEPAVAPELMQAMEYRLVGPFRGGRSTAATGVRDSRDVFYMGTTGGGVWKTVDGGNNWVNVSDEYFEAGSIGAVAVAESDSNVVYAGTGSACPRGNVSPGIGIYRSTDAGATWTHAGLDETGQIGRIRIHPKDPDRVYVAALGQIFGPNEERGVFRSKDGGESWEKVLFVSDRAGAVDLAMDPKNPRILYAAIWEVERKPWTLTSGGEESGLWKSTDGGDSWEELTEGLPTGLKGRIGVSVSGAKPGRVYALVEAEGGGLFRSDNHGKSFRLINADRNLRQRPWYYTHVTADPQDADTVYVMNVGFWRSTDGGKDFEFVRTPHGDNHDMWIHPDDNQVMIEANDGGANVSYNGGKSWSTQANQPTAEFYRVTVDRSVSLPALRRPAGQLDGLDRQPHDLERHRAPALARRRRLRVRPHRDRPAQPRDQLRGLLRRQHRALRPLDLGRSRQILSYPQLAVGQAAKDLRYRFQWNAPIRLSPHDPGVLYHCLAVRPPLERRGAQLGGDQPRPHAERHQQARAGRRTDLARQHRRRGLRHDLRRSDRRRTIPGLLWVGTDDGLIHLSRDFGENWEEVTPRAMPEWGTVNIDRSLALRSGAGVPGRDPLPDERLPSLHLPHRRLRRRAGRA